MAKIINLLKQFATILIVVAIILCIARLSMYYLENYGLASLQEAKEVAENSDLLGLTTDVCNRKSYINEVLSFPKVVGKNDKSIVFKFSPISVNNNECPVVMLIVDRAFGKVRVVPNTIHIDFSN